MVNLLKKYSYTVVYTISLCSCILLVSIVYIVSMQENPVVLTSKNDSKIITFLPQGWAFFTRNPREAQIIIYELKNGQIYEIPQKHSSYKNLLGINRKASKILSELQIILLENVKKEDYVDLQWNYQANVYDAIPTKTIHCKNKMNNPLLCNQYLVIFQKPVPWAWSKSLDKIKMSAKGIIINVECSNDD